MLKLQDLYYTQAMSRDVIYSSPDIKQLINRIKKLKFTNKIHYDLLLIDAFSNHLINDGYDILRPNSINIFNEKDLEVYKIMYKIQIPYLIEKYIVYSNEYKGIEEVDHNELINLKNLVNSLGSFYSKDHYLEKLMFMFSFEQITLQDSFHRENFYRIIKLFENCEYCQEVISKKLGMSLERFLVLYWALFIFIVKGRKTKLLYSINTFKEYVLTADNSFTIQELENFVNYIFISLNEFKQIHLMYRTYEDENGIIQNMSWYKQSEIDRYFPKASFQYPLIKDNDQIILTSYTALEQSLNLNKVLLDIFSIEDNFRGKYVGPAFEKYISNLAKTFLNKHKIKNFHIYGNEKYKIGKDKFDAPDVIIETEEYVLIIESKTSAFNLIDVIKGYGEEVFERFYLSLEKSSKNINRYLENVNNFLEKKVYKIVSYHVPIASMVSSIPDFKEKYEIDDELISVDISSLEVLFNINEIDISKVIDQYLDANEKHLTSSLYHYCKSMYIYDDSCFSDYMHKVLKKFI